jgi:ferric-dicitrate binding protein FerR (iron transport regulator)
METDHNSSAADRDSDPMAQLIRSAGRREAPPVDHYESVRAASHRAWQEKLAERRAPWSRQLLAIAASVAFVILSGLMFLNYTRLAVEPAAVLTVALGPSEILRADEERWAAFDTPGMSLATGDRIRTGAGAAFEFEDGTALRVMAGSNFAIAGPRQIDLSSGTLYLDSGDAAANQPVEIVTSWGRVTDIGTQFEVSASDSGLRVRVRSGLVVLTDHSLLQAFSGTAGDELELVGRGANSRLTRGTVPRNDESWAWAEALALAPASSPGSIREYLTWIARETGREMIFDSSSTEIQAELRSFTGDPSGFSPMELLNMIAATSDFRYELQTDGAILVSRSR